jgi:hypothetical protein
MSTHESDAPATLADKLLAVTKTIDDLLAKGAFADAAEVLAERGLLVAELRSLLADSPSQAIDEGTLATLREAFALGERHKDMVLARLDEVAALLNDVKRRQQQESHYGGELTNDGTVEKRA